MAHIFVPKQQFHPSIGKVAFHGTRIKITRGSTIENDL